MSFALSGNDLTFAQLYDVALRGEQVQLTASAIERMKASRAVVERLVASGAAAYGINTGFGKLASVRISTEQVRQLQVNLVRSHACGLGAPLSEAETRAMTLLRANALAKVLSGGDAMKRAGITTVALEAKEGLSLLNGTQGMLALLSLALREADILVDTADVAASLSLDALRGSPGAFDSRIMHARAYAGAATTARNLARLNEGSQIRESHRSAEKDARVQDAYSLRCTPQVHGAVRDSLGQAREIAAIELNSATDNPLVFVRDANNGDIISGGNFHGQPLAMAADQVAIAIATLGGIVERRVEQMTNPLTSILPAFLTPEPGLNSGFMIAQVTAAALTSENKALATPHSVDSISTSGNQEDYVSMGMSGARRLGRTLVKKAYAAVRAKSPKVTEDRPLAPEIEAVTALVADGTISAILH